MSGPVRLTIDIWSDVMCPWCVIGYKQLKQALAALDGEIEADIRWKPFELNRDLPEEGESMAYHMMRKYGVEPDPAQTDRMQRTAEKAGYSMRYAGQGEEPERRIWNTFLAHRLLHWTLYAHGPDVQTRLKLALFDAHFQQRRNVSDREVLLDVAESIGLDRFEAGRALDDEGTANAVRAEEAKALDLGVTAVPMMLVEGKFMIPGAQDSETYDELLRKVVTRIAA
ncbi:MAG: DsbA family oxidoreductase [Novosphingobium sp.]|nr:DsbA family oxidoreductase [Novosphingobium sp.]